MIFVWAFLISGLGASVVFMLFEIVSLLRRIDDRLNYIEDIADMVVDKALAADAANDAARNIKVGKLLSKIMKS